jgi:hypothetical protein
MLSFTFGDSRFQLLTVCVSSRMFVNAVGSSLAAHQRRADSSSARLMAANQFSRCPGIQVPILWMVKVGRNRQGGKDQPKVDYPP